MSTFLCTHYRVLYKGQHWTTMHNVYMRWCSQEWYLSVAQVLCQTERREIEWWQIIWESGYQIQTYVWIDICYILIATILHMTCVCKYVQIMCTNLSSKKTSTDVNTHLTVCQTTMYEYPHSTSNSGREASQPLTPMYWYTNYNLQHQAKLDLDKQLGI